MVDKEQLSAETVAALEQFDEEKNLQFRHIRSRLSGLKRRDERFEKFIVQEIRQAFATGFERGFNEASA